MSLSPEKKRSLLADGAILFAAMCWGGDYIVVKDALTRISPFYMNGFRFLIAFFFMALIFHRKFLRLRRAEVLGGLAAGTSMFVGFSFLTIGMQYTDAGKAAFITASYVVMVPFILWAVRGIFPGKKNFLGTFLCMTGIILIVAEPGARSAFQPQDLLMLVSALGFAANIVVVDYFVKRLDPYNITILETLTTGLLSMAGGLLFEETPGAVTGPTILSFLYLVFLGTVGTHMVANVAMKYTEPTRASIMFNFESVFAVIFAVIFLGDRVTPQMFAGFLLVFVSVLVTELEIRKLFKNRKTIVAP
jgi:drug/metabolite transporter (DMT)-like permease